MMGCRAATTFLCRTLVAVCHNSVAIVPLVFAGCSQLIGCYNLVLFQVKVTGIRHHISVDNHICSSI